MEDVILPLTCAVATTAVAAVVLNRSLEFLHTLRRHFGRSNDGHSPF